MTVRCVFFFHIQPLLEASQTLPTCFLYHFLNITQHHSKYKILSQQGSYDRGMPTATQQCCTTQHLETNPGAESEVKKTPEHA